MAQQKAKEPVVTQMESNPKPEGAAEDVLMSEVDPVDGSAEVKKNKDNPEILDGTSAEELPEQPMEAGAAAAILARREWEKEQGKLAEVPDPDAKK